MSVIRTLASTENPLFSRASISPAASASRSRCIRNQRTTRRRTFSASEARSAWVIGRAGNCLQPAASPSRRRRREAGGPSPFGMNTPSVTHAWRWTWRLIAEPKRCRKETAPGRGRGAAGASSPHEPPAASQRSRSAQSSRSIALRKIRVRAATACGRSARKPLSRFGTEITHCRTGTGGMTRSTRCAAVCAIRRPLQEGQTPRPLREKATTKPCPHEA